MISGESNSVRLASNEDVLRVEVERHGSDDGHACSKRQCLCIQVPLLEEDTRRCFILRCV